MACNFPRWNPQLDRVFAQMGVPLKKVREIRLYHERLCNPPEQSPRLKLPQQVEELFLTSGITPDDVVEIQTYLDDLSDRYLGDLAEAEEARKAPARAQKHNWREQNRDAYNEYQKHYMRQKRAKEANS